MINLNLKNIVFIQEMKLEIVIALMEVTKNVIEKNLIQDLLNM